VAETKLKAELRTETGKGPAHRLRAVGRVPATLYGHGMDPLSISVSGQDLIHLFHQAGQNALVDLQVDGSEHLAIARDVQRDHLHGRYIHLDFLAIRRDEKIRVSVQVFEVGESVGVEEGGVVEHHLREIELECLPADVPERIDVDITNMRIGDMVHVGEVPPPEGAAFLTDPETPVLSIIMPAILQVEADLTVPGEEPVEVEVPEAEEAAEAAEAEGAAEGAEGEAAPTGEGEGAPVAEEGGEG
jgi:large subunit ribosomal protein L25